MAQFPMPGLARSAAILALTLCALSTTVNAQRGPGNALFLRYPFDKWASENAKPQIKWTTRISPARLSPHQRLLAQLFVTVEADELRKHAGSAQIVVFVRIEDSAGHPYQTSSLTPISQLHQGASSRDRLASRLTKTQAAITR